MPEQQIACALYWPLNCVQCLQGWILCAAHSGSALGLVLPVAHWLDLVLKMQPVALGTSAGCMLHPEPHQIGPVHWFWGGLIGPVDWPHPAQGLGLKEKTQSYADSMHEDNEI